jgi:hypothetical protein
MSQMLIPADAAKYLGVAQSTLFIWRKEFPNELPFTTKWVSNQKIYLYKVGDLETFKLKRDAEKSKDFILPKNVTKRISDQKQRLRESRIYSNGSWKE